MAEPKSIYDLELHETTSVPGDQYLTITRVPGGWIYLWCWQDDDGTESCVVPFDNEFMEGGRHDPLAKDNTPPQPPQVG